MQNSRIGVGIVGAGSIGIRGSLAHLSLRDVQDRVRLSAVCDPVPGRAQAAAERFGVAAHYLSLEELLADPAVDAIVIASPIGLHYDQGLKCIEAGKHVHFNKTMTTASADALDLIARAVAKGVRLVCSPGQMTQPQNREIRKRLMEGAIGQVTWATTGAGFGDYHENESVRMGNDVLSNADPSWYWKKPGGGPLYDMTVYGLHSLTGILGPAKRVTAFSGIAVPVRTFRGKEVEVDADDNSVALVDFGNCLYAFVYGTTDGMINSEWGQPDFYGTKGKVIGTKLNGEPLSFPGFDDGLDIFQRGRHITGAHVNLDESHVFEDTMQLVDWVIDGTPAYGTPEHACHVVEIIEAIYEAAKTGRTQDLKTSFIPLEVE